MKSALLLVLMLLSVSCFGQVKKYNLDTSVHEWAMDILPLKEGKVTYSLIVKVDSLNKGQLYDRAKLWAVKTFGDLREAIQLDEREKGRIIGKAYISVGWQANFLQYISTKAWHTFDINIKDGKVRITFSDIHISYYIPAINSKDLPTSGDVNLEQWARKKNGGYYREENTEKFFTSTDRAFKEALLAFTQFMQDNKNTLNKNDW